jgi:Ferredoxin-like domain in Api92-like protein
MPNHVTNLLTITAATEERVAEIKSLIEGKFDDGESMPIDFNKIIPRPESLNITSGSTTDNGIAILKYRAGDETEIHKIMQYKWSRGFANYDDLINHLLEKGSANLEEAAKALENEKIYGHRDWYSWTRDNWGTKWNAYSQELREDGVIKFETAWSTPEPVICALSRMFPDAQFDVRYADEDFGHNVGEYTYVDGEMVEGGQPEGGSDEAYELAADITGYEDYFTDRIYDIEAESIEELENYEKAAIRYVYRKEILDDFPKVVLSYMEQLAVEDENYEFAEKIKNTVAVNEE